MRWWWVLGVGVMGSALAQEGSKGMSDAERAKRDAEKVFSFIKFHTVKKPAAAPAAKPAATPAPSPRSGPTRPASSLPAQGNSSAPALNAPEAQPSVPAVASAPAPVLEASQPQGAVVEEPGRSVAPPLAASPVPAGPVQPPAAAAPAAPEAEPDEQEVELKLIDFVAPELTAQLQATLGASSPVVKVLFTVAADGKVETARAAAGVPRRLGQVAERAVLQWRFEPLPAAREVEVEIAFRR